MARRCGGPGPSRAISACAGALPASSTRRGRRAAAGGARGAALAALRRAGRGRPRGRSHGHSRGRGLGRRTPGSPSSPSPSRCAGTAAPPRRRPRPGRCATSGSSWAAAACCATPTRPGARVLRPAASDHGGGWRVPEGARTAVDDRYVLFAAGLLAGAVPGGGARTRLARGRQWHHDRRSDPSQCRAGRRYPSRSPMSRPRGSCSRTSSGARPWSRTGRSRRAGRRPGRAQVREPAARRLVQDPRRLHPDVAADRRRAGPGRGRRQRGQPRPGRGARRPAARHPGPGLHAGRTRRCRRCRPPARYGAEVEFVDGGRRRVPRATPVRWAEATGAVLIHPFDHADIVAGQGTVGLEILEQCPDVAHRARLHRRRRPARRHRDRGAGPAAGRRGDRGAGRGRGRLPALAGGRASRWRWPR